MGVNIALIAAGVCIGGMLGGLANAYFTDKGLKGWYFDRTPGSATVWRPGCLGNMGVGVLAALVAWAPNAVAATGFRSTAIIIAFADAVVVGLVGSGYLSAQGKNRLRDAAKENLRDAGIDPEEGT